MQKLAALWHAHTHTYQGILFVQRCDIGVVVVVVMWWWLWFSFGW